MSLLALVGSITLILPEARFKKIVLPLVSLAAGTLIGGAIFHLLPHAVNELGNIISVYISLALGFVFIFILEQYLHWHHCHKSLLRHKPISYLILLADGIHNFVGGLSVGAAFVIDIKLGIITWFVAAAHEIPQELGDFGILVHSGWKRSNALIFNFISALTFPLGALSAYFLSSKFDLSLVLAFTAGNFLYIKEINIPIDDIILAGNLTIPKSAKFLVLSSHGSRSNRFSPRNNQVARFLNDHRLATLLFDLLTSEEDVIDQQTRELRFNIPMLAERLVGATDWVMASEELHGLNIGYFGSSTGAAATLIAAAKRPENISAVVSRGGRPDIAGNALPNVAAPTLLIVGALDTVVIELNLKAQSQM